VENKFQLCDELEQKCYHMNGLSLELLSCGNVYAH